MRYQVGVDIGGTFTDAVCIGDGGVVRTAKALTTPRRLSDGVLAAVDELGVDLAEVDRFIHGTTASLNAFLERRGVPVALLTTAGFRDVYEIGRANRPAMYDVRYRPPQPLVRRRDVREVRERLAADGSVVLPLDEDHLAALLDDVRGRYEALAVCLLHAYANPAHELRVAQLAAERLPGVAVICSSEVAPEWREYERTSTTVLSAYVAPIVAAYVEELERRLVERGLAVPLQIMQSNGGVMTARVAGRKPVQTLFSGPVGGTTAGVAVARDLGDDRLICVDMGGTSFDVSLVVDGRADVEQQSTLEGHPVLAPAVAIHTIGAGGGSVGHVVSGGLRVGPRSAGAEPGPAAYGRGGKEPTVTDANLVLGRLPAVARLGGDLALDRAAAGGALDRVAAELGMDGTELAAGMVAIADNAMANAIREITVRRGIDPRDFTLVAFGGAGPLHAVAIAEELELQRVVVPADPGVLSAWGMLQSDTRHDAVASFYAPVATLDAEALEAALDELSERARLLLKEDGVEGDAVRLEAAADLRYSGQEYTVTVPFRQDGDTAGALRTLPDRFAEAHLERYGHNNPGEAVEFVNLRIAAIGRVPHPRRRPLEQGPDPRPVAALPASFDGGWHETAIYRRQDLGAGAALEGPCVLLEDECTVLVPPGWSLTATPQAHLLLERSGA